MYILIAEDDPDISIFYLTLLNDNGHEVILTKDGEQCLIQYNDELRKIKYSTDPREHIQPFDAVILDHRMPRMNGFEVAKEIISVNSHQRIIIASAYNSDIFHEAANYFGLPLEILQKPFEGETLVNLLEDRSIYDYLINHLVDVEPLKKAKLRHEQLKKIEELIDKEQEERRGGGQEKKWEDGEDTKS